MNEEQQKLEQDKVRLEIEKLALEIGDLRKSPWRRVLEMLRGGGALLVGILGFYFGLDASMNADKEMAKAEKLLAETYRAAHSAASNAIELKRTNLLRAAAITAMENDLELKRCEMIDAQAALESIEGDLSSRERAAADLLVEYNRKSGELSRLKAEVDELRKQVSGPGAAFVEQFAQQVQQTKARVVIEVVQNTVQVLPGPLRGYAIALGSVGPGNAEDIAIFQIPGDLANGSPEQLMTFKNTRSSPDYVARWDKVRTGDVRSLTIGESNYDLKPVIITRRGRDAVQFIFEQK